MTDIVANKSWKPLLLVVFILCTLLLTFSYYDYAKFLTYQVVLSRRIGSENLTEASINIPNDTNQYLVSSSKCKINDLDPFSKEAKRFLKPMKYKRCSKNDLLTYVVKKDNVATVYIDAEVLPQYTRSPITCCYSDVIRANSLKHPDSNTKITSCKEFENNVPITEDAVMIRCTEKRSKKKIYENVHASVTIKENVGKKMKAFENSVRKPLSVLFVGIDSISRLNLIRALPNTYRYLTEHDWISLKGYNKIDDNTFPNLMAILTGYNSSSAYARYDPTVIGNLDNCPMLWYDYRNLGYVTAYAEDEASISTFNYNKKGFVKPPADYYFRPYIMATEKLQKVTVCSMNYCTGPETAGERILNLIKDFSFTFRSAPHFGFFWMNTFSHNDINAPTMMDEKLESFLANLERGGVTNDSIVIFLSDHGIRFGDIRLTETGWLEERLPFIYFSFPPRFKREFPLEFSNFQMNTNKLTTPYDLHMTLQHILTLSGFDYAIKPSDACPNCRSLFDEIPLERSCEDARITEHWCTCAGYTETKLSAAAETRVSRHFVDAINEKSLKRGLGGKCAKFSVAQVTVRVSHKLSYKNTTYLLVILKTQPKALFETTISFEGDILNSPFHTASISRLDYYAAHSHCIQDGYMKMYCYCK